MVLTFFNGLTSFIELMVIMKRTKSALILPEIVKNVNKPKNKRVFFKTPAMNQELINIEYVSGTAEQPRLETLSRQS